MGGKAILTNVEPSIVLTLCIVGTFMWRALGVAVANHIDISSDLFEWFNCVAYAMLAGLISRIILIPSGSLETTLLFDRVTAMVIGFIIFVIFKKNILRGTLTAFLIFLGLTALR